MSTTDEEDDEDLATQGILNEFKPRISPFILGRAQPRPIVVDGHEVQPPTRRIRRAAMTDEEKSQATKAAFLKRLNKFSLSGITSTAAGLPGRLRQLYRRIDKLQQLNRPFPEVIEEIQPIVSKYLAHRMDVAVFGTILIRRELSKGLDLTKVKSKDDIPDEVTDEVRAALDATSRVMLSCEEADALMLLRAEYFHCGLTIQFCRVISNLDYPPHVSMAALCELLDVGGEMAPKRQQRIANATKVLRDRGLELP